MEKIMNLDKMTLNELKDLQDKVAIAIFDYKKRQKAEARAAAVAAARSYGFSLEEVLGDSKAKRASKVAPKYAHPENAELTWTGRGRKPKWIEAALASGKSLKDLEL